MRQIVIWVKDSSANGHERPVIKVGSHWRGKTKQAKLATYLPTAPRVSRLLTIHKLLNAIASEKFCISRSADVFELTNQAAIQSFLMVVERFLIGSGYRQL